MKLSEKAKNMPVAELQARRDAFCKELSALIIEKVSAFENEMGVETRGDDISIQVFRKHEGQLPPWPAPVDTKLFAICKFEIKF